MGFLAFRASDDVVLCRGCPALSDGTVRCSEDGNVQGFFELKGGLVEWRLWSARDFGEKSLSPGLGTWLSDSCERKHRYQYSHPYRFRWDSADGGVRCLAEAQDEAYCKRNRKHVAEALGAMVESCTILASHLRSG